MPRPLTRRWVLQHAAILPWGLHTLARAQAHVQASTGRTPRTARWLLLGTDKGDAIYRAAWDGEAGKLSTPEPVAITDRPDFFALHPSLPVLYTVNSVSGAKAGVSAYRIDPNSGSLTPLNRLPTHGDGPCALSVDRTGRSAFAANYAGGSLSAFSLASDGALAQTLGVFAYQGAQHGPVADRQEAAHLHCTTLSPGNDFLVVCDLGDDLLLLFPIEAGRNTPNTPGTPNTSGTPAISVPLRIAARPGSGPRHVAFHPNGRWMYCIHELDCTIDLYDWTPLDRQTPLKLRAGSTVSTLAPSAPAPTTSAPQQTPPSNTACELAVSDDGRFVYACTRGENSLAVYRVDARTGLLALQQHLGCGGAVPRYFAFDPSRRWLVCCNQGDSTVTVFAHDPNTGRLAETPILFTANTPMFCVWI